MGGDVVLLDNVYNAGVVYTEKNISGGLVGEFTLPRSSRFVVQNSYNVGIVSGTSYTTHKTGYLVGDMHDQKFNNCYFVEDRNLSGIGYNNSNSIDFGVGITVAQLKAADMPGKLGANWTRNDKINNGYPILNNTNNKVPEFVVKIYTADEFVEFANSVRNGDKNGYLGYTIKIMKDINLENREFIPISGFLGELDGRGHTINGLKITNSSTGETNTGLFSKITSGTVTIRNLTLEGEITYGSNAGGFVGYLDGSSEKRMQYCN